METIKAILKEINARLSNASSCRVGDGIVLGENPLMWWLSALFTPSDEWRKQQQQSFGMLKTRPYEECEETTDSTPSSDSPDKPS